MKMLWLRSGWVVVAAGTSAWAQTTELESRTLELGNSFSSESSISADGRFVAYRSNATNLVPGDTNGTYDVFVRDLQAGTTERVSVSSGGTQGNGSSHIPSVSSDGRYVAFVSEANNLVAGDTNNSGDVFVRDRQNGGATERVSVATGGAQGSSNSYGSAISADGRYVAFRSDASNLVAGDTNGQSDVFVRDRQSGTTERVSVATGGAQANGYGDAPAISADGRYVVFGSYATNLVAGDTNSAYDIFVHDRQLNTTERVSVASDGTQSNFDSYSQCSISADGRFVAFESDATNLVAGDTNGATDVFVRDRQLGTTERVSLATGGTQANLGALRPSISADGRFVVFRSDSTNLVAGDTNGFTDVFVRDRVAGTTVRASVAADGTQGNFNSGASGPCSISADGRFVAFDSEASNLVGGDTNGWGDIFVHDVSSGATALVSGIALTGNGGSESPVVSADGSLVAFRSNASNLVAGDGNGAPDVFVANRSSGTIERVSVAMGGGDANGGSLVPAMTPDGRFVAFASGATNLVASDTNGVFDVFLRDRQLGTTDCISVATGGAQGNGLSGYYSSGLSSVPLGISITPDGRYVVFASYATNLTAGGATGLGDVYVRDRQLGTTEMASVSTGGALGNDSSYAPSISADGRYVVFHSFATNLVPGDTNGHVDIFVRDRQAATTRLVSVAAGGGSADNDSGFPVISANGRYVVFASHASNLVTGYTNVFGGVFVRDLQTGTTEIESVSTAGVEGNGYSFWPPSISSDGRFVVFSSNATNLVASDTNGTMGDVFLRDRQAKTTTIVSLSSAGAQGNSTSGSFNSDQEIQASISPGGRFVAFVSLASNLAVTDANGLSDIFLRDRGAASSFVPFCFGDGTGAACPCANSGMVGHGCENSSSTGGAILTASGVASLSADSVHLTSSGEKPTATSVLLSGSVTVNSLHYGDGLRCVGGTLKRLYTHAAVGGTVTLPQGADPSISAKSAASGDVISLGSTRNYQVYYRDPSATFCPTPTGSTFNISNAIAIAWGG